MNIPHTFSETSYKFGYFLSVQLKMLSKNYQKKKKLADVLPIFFKETESLRI